MDNTEKARELINKHLYLHGGDGLGITDGDVYRAVLDAVSEALTIPVVVGRSEQLCLCSGKTKSYVDYSKDKIMCKDCGKPKA
jgi:hypothetical protein